MKENWFDKMRARYKLLIFVGIMIVFSWVIVVDNYRVVAIDKINILQMQIQVQKKQIEQFKQEVIEYDLILLNKINSKVSFK